VWEGCRPALYSSSQANLMAKKAVNFRTLVDGKFLDNFA
jgi:hypothetical protein